MRRHYTFGVSLVSTVGAGFSSSSRGAICGDAPVGMQPPLSKEAAGTLKQGGCEHGNSNEARVDSNETAVAGKAWGGISPAASRRAYRTVKRTIRISR
jgi:hypothetical protein